MIERDNYLEGFAKFEMFLNKNAQINYNKNRKNLGMLDTLKEKHFFS